MEIMVKYLSQEEQSIDSVMLESLQMQLREKEVERVSMLEHLKQVEQESFALAEKFEAVSKANAETLVENQQLKKEIEELRKTSDNVDFVQREKELEGDIEYYQQELKELRAILSEQNRAKQQEISKYSDDIYLLKENLRKTEPFKAIIAQQKKQIQELQDSEEAYRKQLTRIPTLEENLATVEKRSNEFEEKNVHLISEYYEVKSKVKKMESDMKKAVEEREQIEKEHKKVAERAKFWEEKARESEETIRQLQEEADADRSISGIGSLLTQEKEAEYQAEIGRLQREVEQLADVRGEKTGVSVLELKAKLEVALAEKENLVITLNEAKKKKSGLERANEELAVRCKEAEEKVTHLERDLGRAEKDREILLGLSKRAQVVLVDQDKAKSEISKFRDELAKSGEAINALENEKEALENELKEQYEKNIELEKELSRKEEQNILLAKYKENAEQTLKDQTKYIEIETENKLAENFKVKMEELKKKYKKKIRDLKNLVEDKDELLNRLKDANSSIDVKYSAIVKNLKKDYQTRLKIFSEKTLNQIESTKSAETDKGKEHQLLESIAVILNNYANDKNSTSAKAQATINKLIEMILQKDYTEIQAEDNDLKENYN